MEFNFLVFNKQQTSLTRAEIKLLPRSDKKVRGAPCRVNISSTKMQAMTGASIEGTAQHSGQCVR